jgi:hypothetical protein
VRSGLAHPSSLTRIPKRDLSVLGPLRDLVARTTPMQTAPSSRRNASFGNASRFVVAESGVSPGWDSKPALRRSFTRTANSVARSACGTLVMVGLIRSTGQMIVLKI